MDVSRRPGHGETKGAWKRLNLLTHGIPGWGDLAPHFLVAFLTVWPTRRLHDSYRQSTRTHQATCLILLMSVDLWYIIITGREMGICPGGWHLPLTSLLEMSKTSKDNHCSSFRYEHHRPPFLLSLVFSQGV